MSTPVNPNFNPCFEFIEQMSIVTEADGLPKIAGQLMGLMLLADKPLSFNQITEILAVSKASVSNNSRLLEGVGLIERVYQHGDRQTYYQLSSTPYTKLVKSKLNRCLKTKQVISIAKKNMPNTLHQQRLSEFNNFNELMIKTYQQVLEQINPQPVLDKQSKHDI